MSVHRDASGQSQHVISVIEDITERRALEAHVRQASKMDAVGRLASGVAHDFNNLLSVVISYSELLAADLKEGDPMRADLDEIKSAGMRAVNLTRQLLAFSRQQVLQPQIVDLTEIVSGMEKMLRRLIGEDVELIAAVAPALGKIVVDPGQMEQVIMNLVVNARDAMPDGGKVTIETSELVLDEVTASEHIGMKAGPHVMLTVTDTGSGIDKATQARMFEPFFTTKDAGNGTGLGLATVFGIVRQSGGTIWVDGEPGTGTVFKVCFPTTDRPMVAHDSVRSQDRGALRGSETILLVEDEECVRSLARTILSKYGYNVLETQNGGEAFLLCEQHAETIDLLLTDMVMPRMSGRQLAERLVSLRPEMKVLYMSGYTDDAVVRHGVQDSTIAFIQKPITPEALARKVREVLGFVPHTSPLTRSTNGQRAAS
jgi:nitrogen-specific signal transduction histidine kinase/ActR/RegA family two-component response regulator